jgi:hypothetical protein
LLRWRELQKELEDNSSNAKQRITLNVGGKVFQTAKANLLRFENTYFHAMLGSGQWKPEEDGISSPDKT